MAVKKATKKKTTTRKSAPKAADVHIDYPREGDVIPNGGHYAVRVGAQPHTKVEITFDNKKWHACRESVGYYWFDWSPKKTAKVTVIARAKNGSKLATRSIPRKVIVAS